MDKKLYVLLDLAESQIESLLVYVGTHNLYSRTQTETEMISLDMDGQFKDGSPKYIARLKTNDKSLINRFLKKKNKK